MTILPPEDFDRVLAACGLTRDDLEPYWPEGEDDE